MLHVCLYEAIMVVDLTTSMLRRYASLWLQEVYGIYDAVFPVMPAVIGSSTVAILPIDDFCHGDCHVVGRLDLSHTQ